MGEPTGLAEAQQSALDRLKAVLETSEPCPGEFPIAGIVDLAAMKLAVVAHRGIRRDFWDLHEISRSGFALDRAARAFVQRFRKQQGDLYHVIRSLTYFEDAEKDPLFPDGMTTEHWEEIKQFFLAEAPRLLMELARGEGG